MREGGLNAVHVTIAYHETFREMVLRIEDWNERFMRFGDLIMHGRSAADIDAAIETNRTAVFFGFQNPSPIEDDIGLSKSCIRWVSGSCSSATTTSRYWRPVATRLKIRASPGSVAKRLPK